MSEIEEKYQKTLDFLYEQLPMFTRIGAAAYKPDLENTILLCEKLGNPQLHFKSIHIAGTNGKGSCSSLLAVALQKAGYKTALYTSPHIFDFRERIKVNGEDISKEFVVDFMESNQDLICKTKPSFFEWTVAMAFCYFASQQVDIAVVEVGLGGLLDSTNIILPEVSVITNISNDHNYLLGNTLTEIATQKAGIIKKNVPVVIGESQAEIASVFITKAIMMQSPIFFADNTYTAINSEVRDGKQHIKIIDKVHMKMIEIGTDLMGHYQSKNLITVLTTIDVLKSLGWHFSDIDLSNVFLDIMKTVCFKGRFDVVHHHPLMIFDVSHNEAGMAELMTQLSKMKIDDLHIVIGFVKDKSIDKILNILPKKAKYYFVQAPIPRALPHEELKNRSLVYQLQGSNYGTISAGLECAIQNAESKDLILVTGSFFILEEAYGYVQNNLD